LETISPKKKGVTGIIDIKKEYTQCAYTDTMGSREHKNETP